MPPRAPGGGASRARGRHLLGLGVLGLELVAERRSAPRERRGALCLARCLAPRALGGVELALRGARGRDVST
jgi:hypothetical protein